MASIEGEQESMKMSMYYFDFGVDVNVQAPPARDVFDATGMQQPKPLPRRSRRPAHQH